MSQERIRECVAALKDELPLRILLAALCTNVAELAAITARLGYKDLPPEFLARLRAIEEDLQALARLCQVPPPSPKKNGKLRIDEIPLF